MVALFPMLLLAPGLTAGHPTIALVGLQMGRIGLYSVAGGRLVPRASTTVPRSLGVPYAVALSKSRVHLLLAAPAKTVLATYAYGDRPLGLVETREVPGDASSLATGKDGTLWVGRSSGRVYKADALIREPMAHPGEAPESPPSKLRFERRGQFCTLLVLDVISQSDVTNLYVLPLTTGSPASPERVDWPCTDAGFFPDGGQIWALDDRVGFRVATVSKTGTLGRPRVFSLGGFGGVVGTTLGSGRLLVASYDGQIREVRPLPNGRAWLGRPVQTSASFDVGSRIYRDQGGVVLVGSNGIVEFVRMSSPSPRAVRLYNANEPILSDFWGERE